MSLLFHNNTVSLYDNWYESHASLLRSVCLELGHTDKINELMEKFVGEKIKMKAKKNKNLPKSAIVCGAVQSEHETEDMEHQLKRRAHALFEKYVQVDSEFEINIGYEPVRSV